MPLSLALRNQIVALKLHTTLSNRAVSEKLNIPKSTVGDIWKLYQRTGSVEAQYKGQCAGIRKVSSSDERMMVLAAKRNPWATSREIHQAVAPVAASISTRQVRNILRKGGLACYRPLKKPLLTLRQKKARQDWARFHANMEMDDWNKVSLTVLSFIHFL